MKRGKDRVYEVLWPRGKKVIKIIPLAKRLNTLKGKTVCELWDGLFRGDEIFPMIEKVLQDQYPGIKFVNHKVFGSTHSGEEAKVIAALPSKLKGLGCDAVISGNGC